MTENKKGKGAAPDLPVGILEIADLPQEGAARQTVRQENGAAAPPAFPPPPESHPARERTEKEKELDSLISQRQGILDSLKAKNPLVQASRDKIALLVPAIRGRGASHTMELAKEAERIEFSIATEAYTPKKEKELIKRLRDIRQEISKHKEIDDARKAVEAGRKELHSVLSDIKSLERQLAEVRAKCDLAYAAVLSERKSAYEERQKGREQKKQRRLEGQRKREWQEKKQEHESEIQKYMKNYDDTVSMDEICVFEKKEKKKEE